MKRILPRVEQEVKCADEWCGEPVFRKDLCFDHFVEVETQAWDDEDAERQMVLEAMGHIFNDPMVEVLA